FTLARRAYRRFWAGPRIEYAADGFTSTEFRTWEAAGASLVPRRSPRGRRWLSDVGATGRNAPVFVRTKNEKAAHAGGLPFATVGSYLNLSTVAARLASVFAMIRSFMATASSPRSHQNHQVAKRFPSMPHSL